MAKNKIAVVEVDVDAKADRININIGVARVVAEKLADVLMEIGRDLIACKKAVPHGTWEAWVEEKVQLSPSQARKYMLIAKNPDIVVTAPVGSNINQLITYIAHYNDVDSTEEEVDQKVVGDKVKYVESQRDSWKKNSIEWEEKAEELAKKLRRLEQAETEEDVSAEVERLKKQRKLIMADINGAEEAKNAIKVTRDILTERLSAIPALNISARVVKATHDDAEALVGLMENLTVALKEKFNV